MAAKATFDSNPKQSTNPLQYDNKRQLTNDLHTLLVNFTVTVLKKRPSDIQLFAVEYFNERRDTSRPLLPSSHAVDSTPPCGTDQTCQARHDSVLTDRTHVRIEVPPTDDDNDSVISDLPPTQTMLRSRRRSSVIGKSFDPEAVRVSDMNFQLHDKPDSDRVKLAQLINSIPFLSAHDDEQKSGLIEAMYKVPVVTGDKIITQGDEGERLFVIETGRYDTTVETDGKTRSVYIFEGKGCFGESALINREPRSASIVALTDGLLWALDFIAFRYIATQNSFVKRMFYKTLIDSVPMLTMLTDKERLNVADALSSRRFTDGQLIIKIGDEGDGMYFLKSGQVRVTILRDGTEIEVARLGEGRYFGELALMEKKKRTASIYAVDNVEVAFLDVSVFERLLGNCVDVMKRGMEGYHF